MSIHKKTQVNLVSAYTNPKPKPRKQYKTHTQGGCGCTDFSIVTKPTWGLATRPPKELDR
jgi:hypothetical protein